MNNSCDPEIEDAGKRLAGLKGSDHQFEATRQASTI
jgi:hypothetical protein